MKNTDLSLYLITKNGEMDDFLFFQKIEEALKAGVEIVQLREKNESTRKMIEKGKKLLDLCHLYKANLIINDRVDVCLAINADGVHLGDDDMNLITARKILGDKKIIGASVKTLENALKKEKEGADYLGVGAIYKTDTKSDTSITKACVLKEICQKVSIPTLAIGGLNKTNLQILKRTGISGICVVSAIMDSNNPIKDAKDLLSLSKEIIK